MDYIPGADGVHDALGITQQQSAVVGEAGGCAVQHGSAGQLGAHLTAQRAHEPAGQIQQAWPAGQRQRAKEYPPSMQRQR